MARRSANSLKNKIRLAAAMLAFFVCTFGTGAYMIAGLFTDNLFYATLGIFLLSAAGIVAFGWRLADEAVSPIEKVSLLAKSLERGVSTSLPKTSGSSETDELLETIHRNNLQMQNLVGLMDKVSSGNLDVALAPLQTSDRLSNSFQKLLAKVTESIKAKQDLERLKTAIRQVTGETAWIKNGNLDVEIKPDFPQTKEISETLNFLIHRLNEIVAHVRADSRQAQASMKDVRKTIQTTIGADENRARETNRATLTLKKIPQLIQRISEELSSVAAAANQSIERARTGSQTAQENLHAVGALRGQMQEAVKRIGRLNERSQEIGKVVKTVEDLAQRTNMIALNASIQAAELGEKGRGFVVFAEEVERLAERAANTNKQISVLNKTIAAEIGEVEHSLRASTGGAANLSKFAIETGDSLSELEKYIGRFLNLQEKLLAYSNEHSAETDAAFQIFAASMTETENASQKLKESETQIAHIADAMENLFLAVADFKIKATEAEERTIAAEEVLAQEIPQMLEPSFYTLD